MSAERPSASRSFGDVGTSLKGVSGDHNKMSDEAGAARPPAHRAIASVVYSGSEKRSAARVSIAD